MRQGAALLMALLMVLTGLGTGSVAPAPAEQAPAQFAAAEGGNDTLNRTNTFPFDVLFDDYHEYYEVVSALQRFANDFPGIVEFYT
ncbi:MAG: hypothetical protein QGG57_05100, partial [Candidatus Poseidoniia archaeon]|nr:hypothetical protein [Candidatus Poseidoniia archaeon]